MIPEAKFISHVQMGYYQRKSYRARKRLTFYQDKSDYFWLDDYMLKQYVDFLNL